jgi:acyl-coenzyme A synthetase/AMP-(fatty) acid ligase
MSWRLAAPDRRLTDVELERLVERRLGDTGAGRVVVVDVTDPLAAVVDLKAAARTGSVAVVVPPPTSPEAVLSMVEQAVDGLHPSPESSEPGLIVVVTSGSGGTPRAVVRTVASWADSAVPFSRLTGIGRGDVVWAPGGPTATLTLFALWHADRLGLPAVATGAWRGVAAALPTAREATVVQTVPPLLDDILEAVEQGLLPRLSLAVVSGATISARLADRATASGVRLVEYYGAAELSFVAADPDGVGLRPFPGVQVQVRDPDGVALTDVAGEIWARSRYLSRGYLDPHAGGPLRTDAAGWATVGDRGVLWSDGGLDVVGRGDAAVSVGGHTVIVEDVESVLEAAPGVLEVVCLGVPDGRLGERLVAVVRPELGVDPMPAVRSAARVALASWQRPVEWVVLPTLPRTEGGKPARAALRELLVARRTEG